MNYNFLVATFAWVEGRACGNFFFATSIFLRGRNGFDRVSIGEECKQERYILESSNKIIANNNAHFNSVALAA